MLTIINGVATWATKSAGCQTECSSMSGPKNLTKLLGKIVINYCVDKGVSRQQGESTVKLYCISIVNINFISRDVINYF